MNNHSLSCDLRDFLLEGYEIVDALDGLLVELETNPTVQELIADIFRYVHTLKGNSGFFGFGALSELCHGAETVLDMIRSREMVCSHDTVTVLLRFADTARELLSRIERTGGEAGVDSGGVRALLGALSGRGE